VETDFVVPPDDIGELLLDVDEPPLLEDEELVPDFPVPLLLEPPLAPEVEPLELELELLPLFPPLEEAPPPLLRTKGFPRRALRNGRSILKSMRC
jgi:hypothetical protein